MNKELRQFLKTVKTTKARSTYETYCNALKKWFPNSDEIDFSIEYVTNKLASFKVGQNTKVLRCSVLKNFLTYYGYNHKVPNHEKLVDLLNSVQKKQTVPEVVLHEQYKAIRELIKEPYLRLIVDLIYKNGLRISEAVYILTDNFNEAQRTITLLDTKNHNDYKIYLTKGLTQDIADFIKSKRKKSIWLFDNRGKARNKDSVGTAIKKYCRLAGYPDLHAHSFRHGSAVFMLENGVDIYKIKEHLHHRSIKSTERYLHMTPRQHEQVTSIFENA